MRPEAHWLRASVALDLGEAGLWGLYFDSGRAAVAGTLPEAPDLTIRTTPNVLWDLAHAQRPGYEAFLAGELEVRGHLSLALELESLFAPIEPRPEGWPETIHPKVGRLRWSILRAGPPDAQPVFLFHGLGATKASFLTTVANLSRDMRVYACDLPGFGDSAKPIASYDAPWFATRVIELLDALEIKEAVLCGNSMGGRIGIECALRAPERCKGVVALAPALGFQRFRQVAPFVRFLRPELGIVPVRPTRGMVTRVMRQIMADPECLPSHWYEAAADEFFRVWNKPRGRMAFAAAARHIYLDEPHGEAGFWARLAGLEVPATFVFGREDPMIPAALAGQVAEALPHAEIAILDDCGHVPQLEEPDTIHRLIRSLVA